jgi:hypothetical protein
VRAAVGQQNRSKEPVIPWPALILALVPIVAAIGFAAPDPDALLLAAALLVALSARGTRKGQRRPLGAAGARNVCGVRVIRPGRGKQEQRGRMSGYRHSRRTSSERRSRRAHRTTS